MKGLKLFGVVMFLALVFQTSAQAENLKPAAGMFATKSSNCCCPPKKKRAARTRNNCRPQQPQPQPQMVFNPCPAGNWVWFPAQRRCVATPAPPTTTSNRCTIPPRSWVAFRLRASSDSMQQYPFLENDGLRLHYCVGAEERFQYFQNITDVRLLSSPPLDTVTASIDAPPAIDTPPPASCRPATNTVRVIPTVMPDPFYPSPGKKEKVVLTVTFREDGKIGPVQVEQSPSPDHSETARKAALKIRFNPAWENGPVCVTQRLTYWFSSQSPTRTQDDPPQTKQLVQLSPDNGQLFREKQRRIRFAWESVPSADHYFLEVRYSSATSSDWVLHRKIPVYGISHEVEMPGAYPVRWRVMAMRADGTLLVDSDWRRFGYEK